MLLAELVNFSTNLLLTLSAGGWERARSQACSSCFRRITLTQAL